MLKLVVVWCLAGDDVEMSSEGHEKSNMFEKSSVEHEIESGREVQGGGCSASPRKALEVLKLVVVWCLAGDDVEMSSEGHENRKLEGGARR